MGDWAVRLCANPPRLVEDLSMESTLTRRGVNRRVVERHAVNERALWTPQRSGMPFMPRPAIQEVTLVNVSAAGAGLLGPAAGSQVKDSHHRLMVCGVEATVNIVHLRRGQPSGLVYFGVEFSRDDSSGSQLFSAVMGLQGDPDREQVLFSGPS